VTGIKGVIIDRSLAKEAQQWYSQQSGSDQSVIDCLTRDADSKLVGQYEQRVWVDEQISRHGGQRLVWIGERLDSTPASGDGFQEHLTAPKNIAELAADADVIVISTSSGAPTEPGTPTEPRDPTESGAPTEPVVPTDAGAAIELDADDWPVNDGSTLVIDLTDDHPEIAKIKQLGYRVLGENERRIGTLQRCLHRWTGKFPAAEVIHDAIEEYLSV
jgi:hypothetical protein